MYVAPVFPCVNFVCFASAVYRGMCEATMLESGIKDIILKPAAAFFIFALQREIKRYIDRERETET